MHSFFARHKHTLLYQSSKKAQQGKSKIYIYQTINTINISNINIVKNISLQLQETIKGITSIQNGQSDDTGLHKTVIKSNVT